ncbi:MAG: hypothetical protein ABJJ05_00320 [Maribacter litoralis]|uniref:hypothetical protein n=1 Tax=Maribacter litoralis TaxID=2059726 RepID=UPI00329742A8
MKSIYTSNIISPQCCSETFVFPKKGIQNLSTPFSRGIYLFNSIESSTDVYNVNLNCHTAIIFALDNRKSTTHKPAVSNKRSNGIIITYNKNQ